MGPKGAIKRFSNPRLNSEGKDITSTQLGHVVSVFWRVGAPINSIYISENLATQSLNSTQVVHVVVQAASESLEKWQEGPKKI
jgi:hypothetical protein